MPQIILINRDGNRQEVEAAEGQTILNIFRENGIDIEGACEGNMACATCHIVVENSWCSHLPPPSIDEEDMLDLAYGLTKTSRLGCQIKLTHKLEGLIVSLPSTGENF